MTFHWKIFYYFKCLTVSLSNKILTLAIQPLSFSLVSILCEFAMLPDRHICTFYVSSGRRGAFFFLRKQIYTSDSTVIKKIEPFPCLTCLGNTSKIQDCKITALSMVLLVYTFDIVIDELGTRQTRNFGVYYQTE